MNKRERVIIITGVVIGLIAVILVIFFQKPYIYKGSVIEPALPMADFTLLDQDGHSFTMSDQDGKLRLVFFGYTYCPDVCPVTLSVFKYLHTQLDGKRDNLEFIYITVDPERDTQDQMKRHLALFSEDFIGLTGTREELTPVWSTYWVFQEKQETGNPDAYLVDHSAQTYVIDPSGNLVMTFPYGMEKKAMYDDLVHLIEKYGL